MIKKIILVAVVVLGIGLLITVVRLYSLKKDVTRYQGYWQQRAQEHKDDDALLYIAFGDSTAQGIGASSPEKGYVGLVADYLETKVQRPVRVVNLSVSGAKIEDVLKDQLPKLADYPAPNIVTIEIGANDIPSFDEQTFRSSFTDLINRLPDSTVISNVPSFKNGRLNMHDKKSYQAKTIMDELLQGSKHSAVDLYSVTREEVGFFDTAADFFHPNDAAYKKWAGVFIQGIEL